ncbi:unnamed protein product [Choristocarpus tenellus]
MKTNSVNTDRSKCAQQMTPNSKKATEDTIDLSITPPRINIVENQSADDVAIDFCFDPSSKLSRVCGNGRKRPRVGNTNRWTCVRCTYLNETDRSCDSCGTFTPLAARDRNTGPSLDTWICSNCTLRNCPRDGQRFAPSKCVACDHPRYSSGVCHSWSQIVTSTSGQGGILGLPKYQPSEADGSAPPKYFATASCSRCTFVGTGSNSAECEMCGLPLVENTGVRQRSILHRGGDSTLKADEQPCPTCTLVNPSGTTHCQACDNALLPSSEVGQSVDIEEGDCFTLSQGLGGVLRCALEDVQTAGSMETPAHPAAANIASSLIPSSLEELAKRTWTGGDTGACTLGLIPLLRRCLLKQHRRKCQGGGKHGGFRELLLRAPEVVFCMPSVSHFSQRDATGSRWSCGYRNIQMMCSALLEVPEYARVLFGGSGIIPGVPLLQAWIELAWANGYDPEGCEQLGGVGSLIGSETWIGATECAALLSRSFGVKAEVVDFESKDFTPNDSFGVEDRTQGQRRQPRKQRGGQRWVQGQEHHTRRDSRQCSLLPFLKGGKGHGEKEGKSHSCDSSVLKTDCLNELPIHKEETFDRREEAGRAEVIGGEGSSREGESLCDKIQTHDGTEGWYTSSELTPEAVDASQQALFPSLQSHNRAMGGGTSGVIEDGMGEWGRKHFEVGSGDCGGAVAAWVLQYFSTLWVLPESEGGKGAGEVGKELSNRPFAFGETVPSSGVGLAREGRDSDEKEARSPPPLYLQHDGHSRTVVGMERRWGMKGGGKVEAVDTLLVFDPSHRGKEIKSALQNGGTGWARFLKRGVHTLRRRQFQVVAVRPGLFSAAEAEKWKNIISTQVQV